MVAPVSLVIPVRAFDDAKSRLSGVLSARDRRELAIECARRVIGSIPGADVFVVCDDDEVAEFARHLSATAVRVDVEGLNAALTAGMPRVLEDRPDQPVIVAHADLPFGERLRDLWSELSPTWSTSTVVIGPDDEHDGSNVVILGSEIVTRWRFLYGAGSFTAHVAQSRDLGVEPLVVDDVMLSLDLDIPRDLENPRVADQLERLIPNRSHQ